MTSTTTRPSYRLNPASLEANTALADLIAKPRRWVAWKYVKRGQKWTKPPVQTNGDFADSTKPETWADFSACLAAVRKDRRLAGVGFALADDGTVAIDIDDCLDAHGEILEPEVDGLVARLESYAEISPSGSGLRCLVRGILPALPDGKRGFKVKVGECAVEIYAAGRYVTLTGDRYRTEPDLIRDAQPILDELVQLHLTSPRSERTNGEDTGPAFEDPPEALRERFAEALRHDARLRALWDGTRPPGGKDQSRSAWDLALAHRMKAHGRDSLGSSGERFTFEDFAAIAPNWKLGKGADGDARHFRRCWDRVDDGGTTPAEPEPKAADDQRAEIRLVEAHFNRAVRACARALADIVFMRGPIPRILARAETVGGRRVQDRDGEAVEIQGVRYRPGSLLFTEAAPELVGWHLDERLAFFKYDGRAKDWRPVTCPAKAAARVVAAATELGFRACSGFVQVPLLVDGEIISTPGWHAQTRLIIDLPQRIGTIPKTLTKADAEAALTELLRPFRGYLADNPKLRPALAAAGLTAVLRPSLPSAPAILVDASTSGAGKTLLARALAALNMPDVPAIIVEGHSLEETEKRIASAVLQGSSAIFFDNLQRSVASSTLESLLTTEGIATIRQFGSLSDITVECRALILLSANNATMRRDMLRRTLPVRIIVEDEKPELRHFDFNPIEETLRDRGELIAAAFTIAKAWQTARDRAENTHIRDRTLGSFEAWADLVAGAVHWLTEQNPIDVIEKKKGEDPTERSGRAVIAKLEHTFGNELFLAAKAAKELDPDDWREVLTFKGDRPDGRAVGNWLQHRQDRTFTIIPAGAPEGEKLPKKVKLEIDHRDRDNYAYWKIKELSAEPRNLRNLFTQPRENCQSTSPVVENGE